MDLEALSYFGQVLRSGSFSAAARELDIPRQRVHRRIVSLERDLGVRLLDRTTRSLRPTVAGRQMRTHALRILEEGQAARASLRGVKEHPSGTLRVTTTPIFGEMVLGPVIEEFLKAWPETRIEALFTMEPEPLLERDLDLAIRFGPLQDSSLFAKPLGTAQLRWVASPEYISARGVPHDLDELLQHDVLTFNRRPGHEPAWTWLPKTTRAALQSRFSCTLETVVLQACLQGLGVALMANALSRPHLADGTLVEVLEDYRSPEGEFHAVYSGRLSDNPTLLAFLETLEAHLRVSPWTP
ncbi:MAG: LysR family transcriptional regulator [Planctomycetota bacterium]|jgi:DNA-binding transcriptional LysR family regulator